MTGGAATPERRRLVINADDFGYSAGVTRGIIEAHAAGSVTSTSMMANGIDWENAVRLARATRTLDVGVHLNLVQGRPLLRVPSLTDARTGELYPLGALARRALAGRIDAGELEAELRAQIERVRSAGIAVTHSTVTATRTYSRASFPRSRAWPLNAAFACCACRASRWGSTRSMRRGRPGSSCSRARSGGRARGHSLRPS